jgi:hypothetical protein
MIEPSMLSWSVVFFFLLTGMLFAEQEDIDDE